MHKRFCRAVKPAGRAQPRTARPQKKTPVTAEGAVRLTPVRQADLDDSVNEWNRTKEIALARAHKVWVRAISDRANGRYRVFEAPEGRFPDPLWPDLLLAKLVRLAFTDRGRLIDSPDHPLFKKWAARDA